MVSPFAVNFTMVAMKKEYRLVILSCLVVFVLLRGVAIWQSNSQLRLKNNAVVTPIKFAAVQPKPTFQPFDLKRYPITSTSKKGRVKITVSNTPGIVPYTLILAAAVQKDKKAKFFELSAKSKQTVTTQTDTEKVLTDYIQTFTLTYDRKKQTLIQKSFRVMADSPKTAANIQKYKAENDELVFYQITDNALTKKAATAPTDLNMADF
jgi:hypothetical protein